MTSQVPIEFVGMQRSFQRQRADLELFLWSPKYYRFILHRDDLVWSQTTETDLDLDLVSSPSTRELGQCIEIQDVRNLFPRKEWVGSADCSAMNKMTRIIWSYITS